MDGGGRDWEADSEPPQQLPARFFGEETIVRVHEFAHLTNRERSFLMQLGGVLVNFILRSL